MPDLAAGQYRLSIDPERGGSIAAFAWRGQPLLRSTCGPSILDTACFPLVPFSNRIAHGRFTADGCAIAVPPNFPGSDHPHPLHGFGWLAAWDVVDASDTLAVLQHDHAPDAWPWAYTARQTFELDDRGLTVRLSLRNLSERRMPAGLGFHPYFPRDDDTRYLGLHRSEWQVADSLPTRPDDRPDPVDWWEGKPVGTRAVDTIYAGRSGPLRIDWPARDLTLMLEPTGNLPFTVVYTPAGEAFFCVEPVSHATDAVNSESGDTGLVWLERGETMTVGLRLSATQR